jgi:GNAT superfamily N-acetyltransferase
MTVQETLDRTRPTREITVVSGAETRISVLQYERLEKQSWPLWLQFSRSALAEHVRRFPREQFFALDDRGLVGALSANLISWDGDPTTLGTWDALAGERQDYTDTHDSGGNTLVLMSMSIATRARANGVARRLLEAARQSVRDRELTHLVGDFRPSGYGGFKLRDDRDFLTYIGLDDERGVPLDPWLRAVSRIGMQRLRVDEQAMVVDVDVREFERLRDLSGPADWMRTEVARDGDLHAAALSFPVIGCEYWESGQTGTWYVSRATGRAAYVECGVWGSIMVYGSEA